MGHLFDVRGFGRSPPCDRKSMVEHQLAFHSVPGWDIGVGTYCSIRISRLPEYGRTQCQGSGALYRVERLQRLHDRLDKGRLQYFGHLRWRHRELHMASGESPGHGRSLRRGGIRLHRTLPTERRPPRDFSDPSERSIRSPPLRMGQPTSLGRDPWSRWDRTARSTRLPVLS